MSSFKIAVRRGSLRLGVGIVAVIMAAGVSGCPTTYIQGTEIADSEGNLAVYNRVMEYRRAVEERDADALISMVSRTYYENAATTDRDSDDYGYEKIKEILATEFQDNIVDVRLQLLLRRIIINGDAAVADYEYYYSFKYTEGGVSAWQPKNDFNRLEFVWEDGAWMISGGL